MIVMFFMFECFTFRFAPCYLNVSSQELNESVAWLHCKSCIVGKYIDSIFRLCSLFWEIP